MLDMLTNLYLTGVVFNRVSEDAGIKMIDTEALVDYIFSWIITQK